MTHLVHIYAVLGPILLVGASFIALRLLSYWASFLFSWRRYRVRCEVSTEELEELEALAAIPQVKVQITTRGSAGSSEVIARGIANIQRLAEEAPGFYRQFLSVELVTNSTEQAERFLARYRDASVPVFALAVPEEYATPSGTQLKARGLHYAAEQRRRGWNAKGERTFIVHYDEESVMAPAELRKLIATLATTDKLLLEGPIYYPLEYLAASPLCRSMEANRPVGCFECRRVMESGMPLHLHGSNLVVDEAFENQLGWDIGCLDGQPLLAEDYVFGIDAYLAGGPEVFGWHGCAMLEQPPFSFRSAFHQRHRWIFGVLQGMKRNADRPSMRALPRAIRFRLIWGTRYRIATFALGSIVGLLAICYLPYLLVRDAAIVTHGGRSPLGVPLELWFAFIGFLWIGSVLIGAWYNVVDASLSRTERWAQISSAVAIAPIAGILESSAALWALLQWSFGHRSVSWQPTPKTKQADEAVSWRDHDAA